MVLPDERAIRPRELLDELVAPVEGLVAGPALDATNALLDPTGIVQVKANPHHIAVYGNTVDVVEVVQVKITGQMNLERSIV